MSDGASPQDVLDDDSDEEGSHPDTPQSQLTLPPGGQFYTGLMYCFRRRMLQ